MERGIRCVTLPILNFYVLTILTYKSSAEITDTELIEQAEQIGEISADVKHALLNLKGY